MEIKSVSKKLFRATPKIEKNSNHTNPFGVNFQGNMIKADVFETEAKANLVNKISEAGRGIKGKLAESALVGSLGNMSAAISQRLNSVVSFGRRIAENTTKFVEDASKMGENAAKSLKDAWTFANTHNLKATFDIVERKSRGLFQLDILDKTWSVDTLKGMEKEGEMSQLESMFAEVVNNKVMEAA